MAELIPTTREMLIKMVSPLNYRTKTGSTIISNVDSQAEITITSENKYFWITDFVPTIYGADGRFPDGVHNPTDDISVHITVGTLNLTDQPIPLSALLYMNVDDLFSGKVVEPSNSVNIRFFVNHLRNSLGTITPHCAYPLTIYMTLKGYDLPSYKR